MRIKIFLIIFGLCTGAVLISLWPPFIKAPELTRNDIYIQWLISGKYYFVTKDGFLETNPELIDLDNGPIERFREDKPAGIFRIFCLGGSTTKGWPFHEYLSYPKLLGLYLRDLLPGKKIEVINAGFHGSDTYSDTRLLRELVNLKPDLFIIYEGRNDEGNIPLHYAGIRSTAVYLHSWLLRVSPLYRACNIFYDGDYNHGEVLRQFVYKKFDRRDQKLLKSLFLAGLSNMDDICKTSGIHTVFLTQLERSHKRPEDSTITLINEYLKEFALEKNRFLVDVDKVYSDSPISKNDIVMELTSHPDYAGYALISKEVCRSLCDNNIISPKSEWRWSKLKNDFVYFREIGFDPDLLSEIYIKRIYPLLENNNDRAALLNNIKEFKEKYEKIDDSI